MQVGDLLDWNGKRWLAVSADRTRKLMSLRSDDGTIIGVPMNLEITKARECKVVCCPAKDWPCVPCRTALRNAGPLISVYRQGLLLRPYHDWVLDDMDRVGGGNIFFDPKLDLAPGETLIAHFEFGRSRRIIIPANFVTTAEKVAQSLANAREPRTVYDRLMGTDGPFEEED